MAGYRTGRVAEDIKREIVEVSQALTEKMLEREVKEEDHRTIVRAALVAR